MKTARILATLIIATVFATAMPANAAVALPNSMDALGDSITRGFNACGWFSDCTSSSWSTGTEASINSHYLRIKAANPAIGSRVYNDAASGAMIANLPEQANAAVGRKADYITILMGGNDVCTSTEGEMTPVATYRTHLDAALSKLKNGLPNAMIRLLSVPDVKRLWQVGKDNGTARFIWSTGNICQSILANPTSTAPTDANRRDRVRQRVMDYNTQLAQACAAYGPQCSFDGNTVFNYPFQFSQVSRWDYFHPNAEGQKILADITYRM